MASPTQWTWVWVNSGSCQWTERPGMLQSMGSQRVGYNWATELNWSVFHLLSVPDNTSLYEYTTFIYSSVDTWVVSIIGAIMHSAAMNIPLQFSMWTYILILSIYLEVELLDHMVTLYLTSWRTAKVFYKVSAPFYVPTENIWGFQSFHILVNACYMPAGLK